ncbi:MAG: FeoC-like transcriptional regulator [Chloroflexota bacterium]|nr:FeoC-like transcriptional regulator [Chloroflexota bacterium]
MIIQILHEIKTAKGSLNLNDLKNKLGIDRSALEGMIQHLVRTGHLVDEEAKAATCGISERCGTNCTGLATCPFVAKMPKIYLMAGSGEAAVDHNARNH